MEETQAQVAYDCLTDLLDSQDNFEAVIRFLPMFVIPVIKSIQF